MVQKITAMIALAAFLVSPAAGFDTLWHTNASLAVGEQFGFSKSSTRIMQMGNFSPDFFGPVSDYAAANMPNQALAELNNQGIQNTVARQSAAFLHFDNLNRELDHNSKFDYIFSQLLKSTQNLIAGFNKNDKLDATTKKILVLMTLGASLHTVQDFYAHSNWIHFDFNGTKVKMVKLPSGDLRSPTWFEFRDKMGDADKWPFQVRTGIYSPPAGALFSHTHMNHDNSRLMYREEDAPGQPLISQAKFHAYGPAAAKEGDAEANRKHQQLAVNTAIAASLEWVKKVEENGDAKKAIESAKNWDLAKDSPKLAKELEAGMAAQMALSCIAGKWDGENPPPEQAGGCKTVLEGNLSSVPGGSGVVGKILGAIAGFGVPIALRYTGKFWSIHNQYNILGQLAAGFGTDTGHYRFAQK